MHPQGTILSVSKDLRKQKFAVLLKSQRLIMSCIVVPEINFVIYFNQ